MYLDISQFEQGVQLDALSIAISCAHIDSVPHCQHPLDDCLQSWPLPHLCSRACVRWCALSYIYKRDVMSRRCDACKPWKVRIQVVKQAIKTPSALALQQKLLSMGMLSMGMCTFDIFSMA